MADKEPLSGIQSSPSLLDAIRNRDREWMHKQLAIDHQKLIGRYIRAAKPFLLAIVHRQDVADDLAQEFAMKFLKDGFPLYSPSKGRFRDYIKAVLRNLARDYFRQSANEAKQTRLNPDSIVRREEDDCFERILREDLIAAASRRLTPDDAIVLQVQATTLQMPPAERAVILSNHLGRVINEAAARQMLHRARERFADRIIEEVQRVENCSSLDEVAKELRFYRLYQYCLPTLTARKRN